MPDMLTDKPEVNDRLRSTVSAIPKADDGVIPLRSSASGVASAKLARPSSLYRAEIWRLGLFLVRVLPLNLCVWISHWVADAYWMIAKHRRQVVIQNVLPALPGDTACARRIAREVFHHFTRKIIDLWRYEAGLPIDHLF